MHCANRVGLAPNRRHKCRVQYVQRRCLHLERQHEGKTDPPPAWPERFKPKILLLYSERGGGLLCKAEDAILVLAIGLCQGPNQAALVGLQACRLAADHRRKNADAHYCSTSS